MTVRLPLANDGMTEAEAVAVYVAATLPAGESVHFSERGVVLTEHYALLNFAIYPLHDITAIHVRKQSVNHSVTFIIFAIGMISAAILAYISFPREALAVFGGSVLLTLALYLLVPNSYVLRLTLPDGEHDALMARDRRYLLRIVAALTKKQGTHIVASQPARGQPSELVQEQVRTLAETLLNAAWTEEVLISLETQVLALERAVAQTRIAVAVHLLAVSLTQARFMEQVRTREHIENEVLTQARELERARALSLVRRVKRVLME